MMPTSSKNVLLSLAGCALLWLAPGLVRADSDMEFFEKRIRPLLAERCESCHSAAKGKTNGGLALDTRDGWQKGGERGSPITPGKPNESLLIRAVQYVDDGPQMPPQEQGGKLADAEIASLVEWVERGSPDPRTALPRMGGMTPEEARGWWSFQKVQVVDLPIVKDCSWPRNAVDRFVLAELETRKLAVTPSADRRTLLRRATFDLTGLPPTPMEVEAFLDDQGADAFERVVNRLLDSPAYGQRWARHWLDVVRYADYDDANPKTRTPSCELTEAWRYRDWVVDSLNSDLPFDQFIVHQIAGDLLPSPTGEEVYPAGLIATTFLSNGVWDRGDADKEKIVSDMADDNIDTVGKAFLGLTLGCARCHDHKFDPISTEDYYALAGIFYSSHILKELGVKGGEYTMNRVPLVPAAIVALRQQQENQLAEANQQLDEFDKRLRYLDLVAGGAVLVPTEFKSAAGASSAIAADGIVSVSGALAKDTYTLKAVAPTGTDMKVVRLEALSDPNLPAHGPGRASDGNFMVTNVAVSFSPPGSMEAPVSVKLIGGKADFEQSDFAAANAIDTNSKSGWAISPAAGKDHVATFEVAPDVQVPVGAVLSFTIDQQYADTQTLGRFRLSVTNALCSPSAESNPQRQGLVAQRDRIQKEMIPPIPLAMAVQDGGTPGGLFPKIQDVPIHIRGSYARLGAVVSRRLPRFLAGDHQAPITRNSGRRELARWIASKDNPLTARVIVNRVWQWHFGEGLVHTPSNFGKLGEAPTHPELLDWLAAKFVEENWSLKSLHRRIMLSATYQQASSASREQLEQDPENHWLGRFSHRRLEAEAIRDAMLFVAGRLDPAAGGPAGDDFTIPRRALYVQTARWDRSGFAVLFDAANPDSSTERRTVSIVAPQALLLLNHDFVLTQAKQLAERLGREVPNDETARIRHAYQLVFGRPAVAEEIEIARQIVAQGGAQGAAVGWADLAHVMLCSNEFVYVD